MKKLLYAVICLLLVTPIKIYGETIDIKDINLKIELGDDWHVLTRDNLTNNKDLELFKSDEKDMEKYFEDINAYIDALYKDSYLEFTIVLDDVDGINFLTNYPDSFVKELAKKVLKKLVLKIMEFIVMENINLLSISFMIKRRRPII